MILGRGSFTGSFPLFGYDMNDYDVLFEEKLDLFVKLLDEKPVTWTGTTRPALTKRRRVPEDRVRAAAGVGGAGRLPAVGGAHRPARPADAPWPPPARPPPGRPDRAARRCVRRPR
ncbi:hypothetical protein QLQ12_10265 [Actinoplanes sp. NEAU-A12]|uniref:Uncharacterized protein n=1 Tax=Actinoplanes sandaracinus TaxID=3045177 RepID=A0ABT6WGY7_9ACTN|nr:hypothetical protein [Actinoplanes sandaracinus]MDI6098984.1 hypothetical protein [Actinoplanes sandaracinus]